LGQINKTNTNCRFDLIAAEHKKVSEARILREPPRTLVLEVADMTNEKRYCVVVGKSNSALHHLEQVLQRRFEVITAESGEAAVLATTVFRPTLAVIPPERGEGTGELAKRIGTARPGIAIVHIGDAAVAEATDTGRAPPVPSIAEGTVRPAAAAARTPVEAGNRCGCQQFHQDDEQLTRITDRERQVLMLLVRGLSMKEAARLLAISPRTVAFHKYHAMASNGLHCNADLLNFAVREGILTLPEPDENCDARLEAIDTQSLN